MRSSYLKISLVFMLAALILSGCASRNPRPTPSSTLPSGGAGAGGADQGWVVNTDTIYQEDTGLIERGVSIPTDGSYGAGGAAGGGVIGAGVARGPNPNALASVYFGFDQSAIAPGERAKLQTVAARMQSEPNMRIVVEGHCDWRGTTEYNLALGERRAKSVVQYLTTSFGIAQSRFETLSKGDLEATREGTAAQMSGDRRADLIPLR